MRSMEMYIRQLNNQYAVMGQTRQMPDEPPAFTEPDRAADVAAGRLPLRRIVQSVTGPTVRACWLRLIDQKGICFAVGAGQLQQRRRHDASSDCSALYQGIDASGQARPD